MPELSNRQLVLVAIVVALFVFLCCLCFADHILAGFLIGSALFSVVVSVIRIVYRDIFGE